MKRPRVSFDTSRLCGRLSAGLLVGVSLLAASSSAAGPHPDKHRIQVFAGAASKPATEEAAAAFTKATGIAVDLVFGGSGFVLSQMKLAKQGDVYFPGSSDFMELAKREGLVIPETETIVAYLVPAINVPRGNPKQIVGLKDLLRPGLRVAIADPESVCLGLYAVEIVEKNLSAQELEAFRRNLVNYTGSCEKTAAAVALRQVDAVLGWRVFEYWDPERIETVPLDPREIVRIGYLPAAVSRFSQQPEFARRFIDFLASPEGQEIFRQFHYFTTPEEAFRWIGTEKPVGGRYTLPPSWVAR
jgi:molybdate transport system substrate-binding protein